MIRYAFGKGDRKRDKGLQTPNDVKRFDDLSYGRNRQQVLDVYRPKEEGKLPVIINVHGGGWVYGSKEVYQFYCMSLAQRGFAIVNYTYRLAPEHKFPASIEDLNAVCCWVVVHAEEYGFDLDRVFAVGDSAGAHQLALYTCILTNPTYAKEYEFTPSELKLKAIALNCGIYDMTSSDTLIKNLMRDLLPKKGTKEELEKITPVTFVTKEFVPSFVMTATGDFLKEAPKPLLNKFDELGISYEYHLYGTEENRLPHVFHCNVRLKEASECNDDECNFFRQYC